MVQNDNPKHFALTADESELVRRIDSIVSDFNLNYMVIDENNNSHFAFPSDYYRLVKLKLQNSHYRNKRISLANAEELANKVFNHPWYTIIVAGESEQSDKILYRIITSESKGKSILIKEDSPYYSLPTSSGQFISVVTDKDYLEERKALGLSPDHKFLYSVEYIALRTITRLKNPASDPIATSSGDWLIKSSPMLTLPVNVGRAIIAHNTTEGKMKDRGKTIISVGSQQIILNRAATDFLKGNINAQKLFDTIQHEAAIIGYTTSRLAIPLKRILEERGLKDIKELKKQLTSAAAILDDMSFTGQLGGGDYEKLAVTQGDTSIKNGYLYVNINEKFLDGLRQTKQVLLYAPEIMKLPTLGFSYGFARIFAEHKRKNLGKANENRISVQTLLGYAPFPLYDELKDKGQASQKIIDPFLKCFDTIQDKGIFGYRFIKFRGEKLTDQEWEDLLTDYKLFSSLMVEVIWFDAPDYSDIMKSKQKAKAKEARKKKEASKASR